MLILQVITLKIPEVLETFFLRLKKITTQVLF